MDNMLPVIDARKSDDIYKQALLLAKHFCPEWAGNWGPDHFDPEDPGLVIFKLFSNMAEYSNKQLNRIPEKHFIAFLDFMGIDVRSARPSMVPLTFYPVKERSKAQVPSGTLVASSKDPDIVFETIHHLSAIPLELYAFSINSLTDSYAYHSDVPSGKRTFMIFSGDMEEKPLDHILYLGDDDIFDGKTPFENIIIKFMGIGLSSDYFKQWRNGQGLPLEVEINQDDNEKYDNKQLVFNFKNLNVFERSIINGVQSYWLLTLPEKEKRITYGKDLPGISKVTVDLISRKIIPEFLFFDSSSLDMKKGFYPFGETPGTGSSVYIGSGEVLSKENSSIILNIELEKELDDKPVELSWEYWNGSGWRDLSILHDDTNGFRKSGMCRIEFICPIVPECEINGQSNRWIRARIKSGDYGSPGKVEPNQLDELMKSLPEHLDKKTIKSEFEKKGISFGLRYIPPTHDPPFIKSIHFVYSFKDRPIMHILAYNNFSFKQYNGTDTIVPFEPFGIDRPAFYLGFEEIEPDAPVSIYFSIREKILERAGVKWKFFNGIAWKELSIENDETDSFKKSGIISFLFPSEIKKSFEFGKVVFWIRAEPDNLDSYLMLKGIFPNTVWALNQISVNNEILGSGNGLPGQSFSLSKKHILPGQVIEVKEGENLMKWMETSSFAISEKLSRDYMIDRNEGKIFFGDGIHGMIPPKGKNNIIATFYRSGGGKKGNLEAGSINTPRRANPDIELVTNHVPSFGGVDGEDNDSAVLRGPHTIKNGGYAVTVEDFEWLARETSPEIIRAKAFLDNTNNIKIIILTDKKNEDSFSLMNSVSEYIKGRALFTIREKIQILEPEYRRIDSQVTVKPLFINESSLVVERIELRLSDFFNAIKGGKNGKGYDFGEEINVSEVAAVIEDVEGVDYVEEIILKQMIDDNVIGEVSGGGRLFIDNNALPYAGNIEVKITK